MKQLILAAVLSLVASAAHAQHNHGADHDEGAMMDHAEGHNHEATDVVAPEPAPAAALDAAEAAGGELIVVDVLGVVCDFCAVAMDKTFAKRGEVAATRVDLDDKTLTIVTRPGQTLADAEIEKLVKSAGYRTKAIRRGDAAKEPGDPINETR